MEISLGTSILRHEILLSSVEILAFQAPHKNVRVCALRLRTDQRVTPVWRISRPANTIELGTHMERSTVEMVNDFYEQYMFGGQRSSFDKLGFFNVGYWRGVDDSVELAQINLIETLVRFFPQRGGNVLDVACGKGASTKFLTKYFYPEGITGINISERQLQICRLMAPECNFLLMDATKLDFDDASFDNVLCIESAVHFMTRYRFFEEAYRVLKPGGRLAMSDVVVHNHDLEVPELHKQCFPKENCLPNLNAYRDSLLKAGFKYARVEDCTDLNWTALQNAGARRAEIEFNKNQDYKILEDVMKAPTRCGGFMCMAYAIK